MQRRKLGTAVVWMVCLLGMVAVVWSRPPLGSSRSSSHPPLALAAADQPLPVAQSDPFDEVPVTEMPAVPVHVPVTHSPLLPQGEWLKEAKPYRTVFRFEGQRLHITLEAPVDSGPMTINMSADFQVTQEAMLYGVVTSAKVDMNNEGLETHLTEDLIARAIIDQPFALRFRLDEEALTIKEFKMAPLLPEDQETWQQLVQWLTSRFERKPTT